MPNIIQQLKQYAVYLDGRILQGNVSEVNIPDLDLETQDVRPNTFGTVEVSTGLKKLNVSIKVRGIHPDVASAFDGVNGEPNTRLDIRAALENYQALTVQAVWEYVGLAKTYAVEPLRGRGELAVSTLVINANAYKHSIAGREIHYIDILNNIMRIRGHDRLAGIRRALEGEIISGIIGEATDFGRDVRNDVLSSF